MKSELQVQHGYLLYCTFSLQFMWIHLNYTVYSSLPHYNTYPPVTFSYDLTINFNKVPFKRTLCNEVCAFCPKSDQNEKVSLMFISLLPDFSLLSLENLNIRSICFSDPLLQHINKSLP
jgi:hypothetical protein